MMTTSKIQPFQSGERLLARRQNEIVTPVNRMIEAGADVLASSSPDSFPRESFGALIDGSVEDGTNRWEYLVTAVKPLKTQAGPDGYVRVDQNNTRFQVTARNALEDGNSDSGPLGIGALAEQLEGAGATLQPVPDDRYVRVFPEPIEGGGIEYVFWGFNIIDAECSREPDRNTLQVQQAT